MLTELSGVRTWICRVMRAPVKSFVGTPIFVAEPIPDQILDSDIPVSFEYYNEHPDFDPPKGSFLEGWEGITWVADFCSKCREFWWRPLISLCPLICDYCQDGGSYAKAEEKDELEFI